MKSKERIAIIVTLLFLFMAFGLYLLIRVVFKIKGDDISFTVMVILPLFVYLVLSDKIKGFKAGNFEATFRDVANSRVVFDDQEVVESTQEEIGVMRKGSLGSLKTKLPFLQNIDESKKYILTLRSGQSYNSLEALREYLRSLVSIRNFRFVVVLNQDEKVVSYSKISEFAKTLENQNFGDEFIELLNDGKEDGLMNFPGFMTKTISQKASNLDALKLMDELNLDVVLVVNGQNKLQGLVEREKLLTKLLLSFSK